MLSKRSKVGLTVISAGLAALSLWSAKYFFLDNRPQDVLLALISTLGGDYTVHAEGYRESNFLSLRPGMTPRQVEEIMGPPISIGQWQALAPNRPITPEDAPTQKVWRYSRPGKTMGNFWRREVWFEDGVVRGLERGFLLD